VSKRYNASRRLRAAVGAASLVASIAGSTVAHAQGLLRPLPLPPIPAPLPAATSDTGRSESSSATTGPFLDGRAPTACPGKWLLATTPAAREALWRSRRPEVWAGWETATVDASAVAALLVGAEYHDVRGALVLSSFVYALGAPVVHFARGEIGKGLASLALRFVLPAVGFGVGAMLGRSAIVWSSGRLTIDEGVGLAVGAAGASAVDAEVLGWHRWIGAPMGTRAAAFGSTF
jgi:hypothetical protein